MKLIAIAALLALTATCASAAHVTKLTPENFDAVTDDHRKTVLVLFYTTWTHKHEETRDVFAQVAAGLTRDDIEVAEYDATSPDSHAIARNHDIGSFPSVVLYIYAHDQRRYSYPTHSFGDLTTFALEHADAHLDWKDGEAKKANFEAARTDHRNHAHPAPGTVVELGDSDFKHYTGDYDKTVVVLFYSPTCQYCKEMYSIFDEMAKYFEEDHRTVVAKVNVDEAFKTSERLKVDKMPTIKLFPKGSHAKLRGEDYNGEREVTLLQTWVDGHNANLPIKGEDHANPFQQHEDGGYVDHGHDVDDHFGKTDAESDQNK